MASVVKESSSDVFVNLSYQLGGLEQKLAVEALLSGKDVIAILPIGFGKSIIYQSFVKAKNFSHTASIVVVFRFAVLLLLNTRRVFVSSIYLLWAPKKIQMHYNFWIF